MFDDHAWRAAGRRRSVPPLVLGGLVLVALLVPLASAQGGPGFPGGGGFGTPPPGAPGGFPGGDGGFPGAPGGGDRLEIVDRFDVDGDGFLDAEERTVAKAYLESSGWNAGGRGPGGGRGGAGTARGSTGVTIAHGEVTEYSGATFFDTSIVRTIFVETGFDGWEAEMAAFYDTDVELPVTVTIDGVEYEDVGMRFRGNSSFSMVSAGLKRPIRIKLDTVVDGQNVEGVRTVKLLNGVNDPSFLRTVLTSTIMQDYIAAPRVNFVRLVVNGENWGIFQNQQHYNTDFLRDHFGESGGVRWEVPGSPNGRGGMVYLGDDPELYRSVYEIQNRDTTENWASLIDLFRVIDETPGDRLVEALEPILDIEGALRFLALDVVLANSDGFWARASDYELYLDESGRFHIIPHDLNEALGAGGFGGGFGAGGRGGRGGGGGDSTTLDPLIGLTDSSKPLRSKLLAVPELQKRYLEIVLDIAERWLDWDTLGLVAEDLFELIVDDMAIDTRSLYGNDQFEAALDGGAGSVRSFVEQRRAYLLSTVPALIAAIPGDAYAAPTPEEADAAPAVLAQAQDDSLIVATTSSYAQREGPDGWHLTAGTGAVVVFDPDAAPVRAAAFTFDALTDGFGANKLDQCVPIDAARGLSIGLEVYADTPSGDATGLAVRVNPNFHATRDSCEAAMVSDSGGDRLAGDRGDEDIDTALGRADGGVWLVLDETTVPALAFEAGDVPDGATHLRLSLRARDRSGDPGSSALYLASVSVQQEPGVELVVNGDFTGR